MHRGREAALRRFASYTEPLGDFKLEFEAAIDGQDALLVTAVMTAVSRGAEVPVQGRLHYVVRYRDGKIIELRVYQDRAAALAAAGVAES